MPFLADTFAGLRVNGDMERVNVRIVGNVARVTQGARDGARGTCDRQQHVVLVDRLRQNIRQLFRGKCQRFPYLFVVRVNRLKYAH